MKLRQWRTDRPRQNLPSQQQLQLPVTGCTQIRWYRMLYRSALTVDGQKRRPRRPEQYRPRLTHCHLPMRPARKPVRCHRPLSHQAWANQ